MNKRSPPWLYKANTNATNGILNGCMTDDRQRQTDREKERERESEESPSQHFSYDDEHKRQSVQRAQAVTIKCYID